MVLTQDHDPWAAPRLARTLLLADSWSLPLPADAHEDEDASNSAEDEAAPSSAKEDVQGSSVQLKLSTAPPMLDEDNTQALNNEALRRQIPQALTGTQARARSRIEANHVHPPLSHTVQHVNGKQAPQDMKSGQALLACENKEAVNSSAPVIGEACTNVLIEKTDDEPIHPTMQPIISKVLGRVFIPQANDVKGLSQGLLLAITTASELPSTAIQALFTTANATLEGFYAQAPNASFPTHATYTATLAAHVTALGSTLHVALVPVDGPHTPIHKDVGVACATSDDKALTITHDQANDVQSPSHDLLSAANGEALPPFMTHTVVNAAYEGLEGHTQALKTSLEALDEEHTQAPRKKPTPPDVLNGAPFLAKDAEAMQAIKLLDDDIAQALELDCQGHATHHRLSAYVNHNKVADAEALGYNKFPQVHKEADKALGRWIIPQATADRAVLYFDKQQPVDDFIYVPAAPCKCSRSLIQHLGCDTLPLTFMLNTADDIKIPAALPKDNGNNHEAHPAYKPAHSLASGDVIPPMPIRSLMDAARTMDVMTISMATTSSSILLAALQEMMIPTPWPPLSPSGSFSSSGPAVHDAEDGEVLAHKQAQTQEDDSVAQQEAIIIHFCGSFNVSTVQGGKTVACQGKDDTIADHKEETFEDGPVAQQDAYAENVMPIAAHDLAADDSGEATEIPTSNHRAILHNDYVDDAHQFATDVTAAINVPSHFLSDFMYHYYCAVTLCKSLQSDGNIKTFRLKGGSCTDQAYVFPMIQMAFGRRGEANGIRPQHFMQAMMTAAAIPYARHKMEADSCVRIKMKTIKQLLAHNFFLDVG